MRAKTSLFILFLLLIGAKAYGAFDLLKGVMPGEVSGVHEKYEGSCLKCHTLGQKHFLDKCLECHKEVKTNLEKKTGFHGKIKIDDCESCHAEHKGRSRGLIDFDRTRFDHKQSNFELTGKHKEVKCNECHLKKKYRETPHDCFACHLKKDKHKGALGKNCERCHNAGAWNRISFDHSTTKFPLRGKHRPVACEKCHSSDKFTSTPTTCVGCHLKQDKHKGTLGSKCELCHTASDWKKTTFDHDKTDFKLIGLHQKVECLKCHKSPRLKETPKACYGCHRKDDKHRGIQGTKCELCHTSMSWKKTNFDHDKTDFKLIGLHQKVECAKCHKTTQLKQTPKACYGCHRKEDRHKGKLGEKCERCHSAEKWKRIDFDHSTTRYRLVGKHLRVPCSRCHVRERYQIPSRCSACHLKDDKHRGKLGNVCSNCHTEKSWKDVGKFDHQKTVFPLTGKHTKVRCSQCHQTPLFKGTSSFCNDCHAKDDYHKGDFGKKCDSCHDASSWKRKRFDHARETGYPLEGKHRDVKCTRCHTRPIFSGRTSRMCVTCHRKDDPHNGELGARCDICHSVVGFKVIKRMSFGGAAPAGLMAAHPPLPGAERIDQ